jgi:putative nucleotidyltransferase with HDIG domain
MDSLVERINHLPSFPQALSRIISVVSSDATSMAEMAEAIRLDPVIAGKVLRLSNSAYVGMPRTVSSLENAVVILGQRRIQSLVLASVTLDSIGRKLNLPFAEADFWRHSVITAIISETIARHMQRYDPVEPGELFCAGLLHDLGKLAIGAFEPSLLVCARESARIKQVPFFKAEDEETSHFTTGALCAQKWNYPPDLRNAILYHHDPLRAEPFIKMAATVHLADVMSHIMGFRTFEGEIQPTLEDGAVSCVGLQPETLRVIAAKAVEDEKKTEAVLDFVK